jgi:hypothetical protein
MAEAAALALGAQIICALGVQPPFFLSDNQQLVNFFNFSMERIMPIHLIGISSLSPRPSSTIFQESMQTSSR